MYIYMCIYKYIYINIYLTYNLKLSLLKRYSGILLLAES